MKVARTVLSGGKDGDNFKVLPIATVQQKKEYLIKMLLIANKYPISLRYMCILSNYDYRNFIL
ncbi:hypothetical protein [Bacillus paramycoides]|uniref:hypothetical protein n=1 Tax=Bacillus paramycoides TaxID=2026194 RepID=UPI002E20F237|nr:hypothetical protein [Bacillus paramycoides]